MWVARNFLKLFKNDRLNESNPKYSARKVTTLIAADVVVITTGVLNLAALEWGDRQVVERCSEPRDAECSPAPFNAPLAQQLCHTVAQALCLLIHLADKFLSNCIFKKSPRIEFHSQVENDRSPPYVWILPALLDFGGAVLPLFATTLVFPTVVQVLRNLNLVLTACFASCLLGTSLTFYQWSRIVLLTIGCTLVGWNPKVTAEAKIEMIGILLALIGTFFLAFLNIYQESVYRIYKASPLESIGWIGLFELWPTLFAIGLAHVTGFNRVDVFWYQITHSKDLRLALTIFSGSVMIFAGTSMCVLKLGGAVHVSKLFAMRSIPLYFIHLRLGWRGFTIYPLVGVLILSCQIFTHFIPWHKICPRVDALFSRLLVCRCRCILEDPDICFQSEDDDDWVNGNSVTQLSSGQPDKEIFEEDSDTEEVLLHRNDTTSLQACITNISDLQSYTSSEECWIYVDKEIEWDEDMELSLK